MTSANNFILNLLPVERERNVEIIQRKVQDERKYQIKKFKHQHKHPFVWLGAAVEEAGECAKAILEDQPEKNLALEVVQTMAVCQAWLEDMVAGMSPDEIEALLTRPPKDDPTE